MAFALVTFYPQDATDPTRYDGGTDKDGSFSVQCPRGAYKVTINPLEKFPTQYKERREYRSDEEDSRYEIVLRYNRVA